MSVVLSRLELGAAGFPAALTVLLSLAAAVAGGAGLSLAVERVAFRPFRGQPPIVPLIATVAVSFVLYQAAGLWRLPFSLPALLPQAVLLRVVLPGLDLAVRVQDVLVLVVATVLAQLTDRLLYATRSGRAIEAWSHDPEIAQLMDVHRTRTLQLVFLIAGWRASPHGRRRLQHTARSAASAWKAA